MNPIGGIFKLSVWMIRCKIVMKSCSLRFRERPTHCITGKKVKYFHYKVCEEGCDPGEVVKIRCAWASVNKRTSYRLGESKILDNGLTERTPPNALDRNEAIKYYKR